MKILMVRVPKELKKEDAGAENPSSNSGVD